jgi:hypothetical protein
MFPSSSRKKKHSNSNSALANGVASQSQASQQLQFPTKSQSQSCSQSLQQTQQSQPVYPWSAQATPSGSSLLPSPQEAHTLSTTTTRDLYLFGGYVHKTKSPSNDLYVISTRDFSATLVPTSGDVPNPRSAHGALLTSTTTLLIWGGTDFSGLKTQEPSNDDSFYKLNLGTLHLFDVKTRSS